MAPESGDCGCRWKFLVMVSMVDMLRTLLILNAIFGLHVLLRGFLGTYSRRSQGVCDATELGL
jgi:hypothetical protein